MKERFIKLFEFPKNLYSENSPIIVEAGVLLKDTQTNSLVAQLKFKNIIDKVINGVKISLTCKDITGAIIDNISYQYADIYAENGTSFGSEKAIILNNEDARSYNFSNIIVSFVDNSTTTVELPLNALPDNTLLESSLMDSELVKQYKINTTDQALNVPQKLEKLWQCTCGSWNGNDLCNKCLCEKELIFSSFDESKLKEEAGIRVAKEREIQEIEEKRIAEENIKKQELIKQNKDKLTTLCKAVIIVAVFVEIILTITYFIGTDMLQLIPCGILSVVGLVFLGSSENKTKEKAITCLLIANILYGIGNAYFYIEQYPAKGAVGGAITEIAAYTLVVIVLFAVLRHLRQKPLALFERANSLYIILPLLEVIILLVSYGDMFSLIFGLQPLAIALFAKVNCYTDK